MPQALIATWANKKEINKDLRLLGRAASDGRESWFTIRPMILRSYGAGYLPNLDGRLI